MCLIAGSIFQTAGYPSNTVHWLSMSMSKKYLHCWHAELPTGTTTDLVNADSAHNRSLNAVCAYHFLMTLIYFGHNGAFNRLLYERGLVWMWPSDKLARSANLPEGLYILLALISFFFSFVNLFARWKHCFGSLLLAMGDTAAPSRLYARLCHAFLVFFNDFSETNNLRIRWTDFCNLYVKWKLFGCRWSIWTFFWYVKGRCHGNRFCAKMGQNYLPPALIAVNPKRNGISIPQWAQMMPVYCVKISWNSVQ